MDHCCRWSLQQQLQRVAGFYARSVFRRYDLSQLYLQEFRRIQSSLTTSRERAELVGAFHSVREEDLTGLGPASRGGQETALLREQGAIYGNVAQVGPTEGAVFS